MRSKIIIFSFCFIAILAAFWLSGRKDGGDAPAIRIATDPWPGFEFLHLAQKKGFFEAEGVSVQLVRFSTLEDAHRAYARGQVDGMASTLIELLQAHEEGRESKIALVTDFSNGADVVLAGPGISRISDLKGKRVGVEPPFSVYVIALALQSAGLSLDDIKMENMDQISLQKALLSNQVDAIHTYEPYSTATLRQDSRIKKIFDSAQLPGELPGVLILGADIVAGQPQAVDALRRAWERAVIYAHANPDEAARIMAAMEDVSPADFSNSLKGDKILDLADQQALEEGGTLARSILKVGQVLRAIGQIKETTNGDKFLISYKNKP